MAILDRTKSGSDSIEGPVVPEYCGMSTRLLISSARNETNLEIMVTYLESGDAEVLAFLKEIKWARSQSSCSCVFN